VANIAVKNVLLAVMVEVSVVERAVHSRVHLIRLRIPALREHEHKFHVAEIAGSTEETTRRMPLS
jgi:hypothetical protein